MKDQCSTLEIKDNRNGRTRTVEIKNDQYIEAAEIGDFAHALIYDPAFRHTAVAKSSICFVDGSAGVLLYRGYRIEDLIASDCSYTDVAHLLIHGELPTKESGRIWQRHIMTHTFLHSKMEDMMKSFNYDAHPMGMFISAMAALSTFHADANPSLVGSSMYLDAASGEDQRQTLNASPSSMLMEEHQRPLYDPIKSDRNLHREVSTVNSSSVSAASHCRMRQIYRIIGKATTVAAAAYRHRIGRAFNRPQNGLSYAANFLYMLDALGDGSSESFQPHPVLVKAIDQLFIVHAEHEFNCSTTAMQLIASTMVDPFSAVAGAAAALYGPTHGGASEAVVRMLANDIGSVEGIPSFLERVKNKQARLMGFGHRIYKEYDPRARIVRSIADRVFAVCGQSRLVRIAIELEKQALADEYFVSRKLYPNVDYYSGLVYQAMGFPTDFFPLLFAIPRISGWLAHWHEMMSLPNHQSDIGNPSMSLDAQAKRAALDIWRPRQIYVGHDQRDILDEQHRQQTMDDDPDDINVHPAYRRYVISVKAMRPSSYEENSSTRMDSLN